jgi:hypothetical protein
MPAPASGVDNVKCENQGVLFTSFETSSIIKLVVNCNLISWLNEQNIGADKFILAEKVS